MSTNTNRLQVSNLAVKFTGEHLYDALAGISFHLKVGKTTALIGQSGSGKSVCSLAIMGLLARNAMVSGTIQLGETSLLDLSAAEWTKVRGKRIGMIFQEPMSALNPIITCGAQLVECIQIHQKVNRVEAKAIALDWLQKYSCQNPKSYSTNIHIKSQADKNNV